jgi:hypothetical protein
MPFLLEINCGPELTYPDAVHREWQEMMLVSRGGGVEEEERRRSGGVYGE